MGMFSLDFSDLEKNMTVHANQKSISVDVNKIPYNLNQQKFVKVAFDMFQSKFDNTIWELAEEENSKYLVKRTDLGDSDVTIAQKANAQSPWSVTAEKDQSVVLYLFSVPVRKFSPQKFNYNNETSDLFAKLVLEQVSSNPVVAKKYIRSMQEPVKNKLIKKCKTNLTDDSTRSIYSLLITGN